MSELFVIVVFYVVSYYVGICNLALTRESLRFLRIQYKYAHSTSNK